MVEQSRAVGRTGGFGGIGGFVHRAEGLGRDILHLLLGKDALLHQGSSQGDYGIPAARLLHFVTGTVTAVVVVGVLVATRLVVPHFLDLVARTRQRDLFVLSVLLVCLGTAWAVSTAGVSLAVGAFLAGLVVSGSRYREQAISDLVPLRDVLASVFFVSIGMLLDLRNVRWVDFEANAGPAKQIAPAR